MKIEWTATNEEPLTLKSFLKSKRISKRLLAKVKFQGGRLEVNQEPSRVRKLVTKGDRIALHLPEEPDNDRLKKSTEDITVLFEDEHFLIVNKQNDVPSVPSSLYSNHTMANRVKGYIIDNGYKHKTVHVVTRLDKDTSGIMIFAKHGLAHSYLDQLLHEKDLYKEYTAFVEGTIDNQTGCINEPIGRMENSIIKRQVMDTGKPSMTEYWVKKRYAKSTQVKIQLHTGRTHQIRVHFSAMNHALLGDTLYNPAADEKLIARQALHCSRIIFEHPFTGERVEVKAPLPDDLMTLSNQLESMSREQKL